MLAWSSVLATEEAVSHAGASIVLPDQVVLSGARRGFSGWVRPARPGRAVGILQHVDKKEVRFSWTRGETLGGRIGRVSEGTYTIVVQGVPYNPYAYERVAGRLRVLARGEALVLIDGRMATAEDTARLAECIELLTRRGEPIVFHAGPQWAFADVLQRLRKARTPASITCQATARQIGVEDTPSQAAGRALELLLKQLRFRKTRRGSGRAILITGDAKLAKWAAVKGCSVRLIGTSLPPTPGIVGLKSLGMLKEQLLTEPISE